MVGVTTHGFGTLKPAPAGRVSPSFVPSRISLAGRARLLAGLRQGGDGQRPLGLLFPPLRSGDLRFGPPAARPRSLPAWREAAPAACRVTGGPATSRPRPPFPAACCALDPPAAGARPGEHFPQRERAASPGTPAASRPSKGAARQHHRAGHLGGQGPVYVRGQAAKGGGRATHSQVPSRGALGAGRNAAATPRCTALRSAPLPSHTRPPAPGFGPDTAPPPPGPAGKRDRSPHPSLTHWPCWAERVPPLAGALREETSAAPPSPSAAGTLAGQHAALVIQAAGRAPRRWAAWDL